MISLNVQKTSTTNAITADLVIGSGRTLSPTGTGVIQATSVLYGTGITETSGTGSPQSVVTANVGSVYHRTDGGTGTTLYIKESGTGNTGWVAVVAGGAGDMLLGTAQTVTAAKTFNTGTLKIGSSGDLVDTNGNELFKFTATASAVNESTIANSATGAGPTFSTTGGDANIDMSFLPKGSGKIQITGARTATGVNSGVVHIRSTTTSAGALPVYVVAIDRNNSSTPAWYLGADGNDDAVFATNNATLRIGSDLSGTFTESLRMAAGNLLIGTTSSTGLTGTGGLSVGSTTASTTSTTGAAIVAGGLGVAGNINAGGSISSGAPTSGTAAAWKLGSLVTASVTPDTTRYIQLDVGGTLYKLIIST